MAKAYRTPLYERHVALGAAMVEFGGWEMPLHYAGGIVQEHLATRKGAGLFDVSHMGRFRIAGSGALGYLQHVLTCDAGAVKAGTAQYAMIGNEQGGAIDDAYLYHLSEGQYLLVVNAGNRGKDWGHLTGEAQAWAGVRLTDDSESLAMLSLQGPRAREMLGAAVEEERKLPVNRDGVAAVRMGGVEGWVSRTGYTGEPVCFEIFVAREQVGRVWDRLVAEGARPVGLGARDTLRLEDGLPLYGHELGEDAEGKEIPIFACGPARRAVSFSAGKGEFIGKGALQRQAEAWEKIQAGGRDASGALPRRVRALAVLEKVVARQGAKVFYGGRQAGYVTSGTMVPYWKTAGAGLGTRLTKESGLRPVCLALIDSALRTDEEVEVEIRGQRARARVVRRHLDGSMAPYAHPVLHGERAAAGVEAGPTDRGGKALALLKRAAENHQWRQRECINLIPSEQTPSPMVRRLSIMDPMGRYAEHRRVKELGDAEVYYYQGTDFIREAERLLEAELREYLGCNEVETRVVSGQMANAAVFSAMVDYVNRGTKGERRRLQGVMNNHIIKGGHLSAQPMGALHDYIGRDPATGKAAVVNFPVQADNPYRIDVEACRGLLEKHRPELIIFGKSMVLHREPVAEVRRFVDELKLETVIMYDMAHVLGLAGRHFQEPFKEGADVVTGSTHKTFFGTQRGVVATNFGAGEGRSYVAEAVRRRTFPGSVSNHHLGTLLGLLLAAYEMNTFKDEYQRNVVGNAKALARALAGAGLKVAGDAAAGYTETHQVIVKVGYARGPEMARKLEESNIICNYQATPEEDGFSAAGALRLGVQEMTRFGMVEKDFETLAGLMAEVILEDKAVVEEVKRLRGQFVEMRYCFNEKEYEGAMQRLHELM